MDNTRKTDDPIKGVNCAVESCTYHTEDGECLASSITVTPCHDSATHDTDCSTYRKRSGMESFLNKFE